jgi:hypothetical protein
MSRHLKVVDHFGGRYEQDHALKSEAIEYPMDWCAMVFKLARKRALPDLRGGRK